ncbi:riboflavin transporter MCH5 [Xylariaceae sp. FL0016]|nr:riboflavin transporter MCH5 [Xylariaceae sp. FL0016]
MTSTTAPCSSDDGLPSDVEKQSCREDDENGRTNKVEGQRHDAAPGDEQPYADEWQIEPEPDLFNTGADGMAGAVSRVLSKISTNASWNPGPPPDGGKAAWLMCFFGHIVIMNTWGFINSFGVFQTYYATLLNRPPSDISWIGSIQVFLTFFIGTFTGRLIDAGLLRPVLATGTFFMTLGIFTTSAATEYWQLLLSQGLCMGLGSGCLFCPTISTTSTYFSSKRALALGIVACGSVTGGLVFPAMARQLLPSAGFGWSVRAIGFVQCVTLVFANLFLRSRLPPRRAGRLIEWTAFREPEYALYAAGCFFNFWGLYFAFYYVAAFGRAQIHPVFEYEESLNVLLLMNGISVLGRIVPNHLADRFGPLNIMVPVCFFTGIALLAWMAVHTPAQLYVWAVFYGIVAGGLQGLFPAGLSSLTTDLRKQGTRMGMVFTIVSFAVLTGNPIAGAIVSRCGGKYWGAQLFTGLSLMVGMTLIAAARWVRMRRTGAGWGVRV